MSLKKVIINSFLSNDILEYLVRLCVIKNVPTSMIERASRYVDSLLKEPLPPYQKERLEFIKHLLSSAEMGQSLTLYSLDKLPNYPFLEKVFDEPVPLKVVVDRLNTVFNLYDECKLLDRAISSYEDIINRVSDQKSFASLFTILKDFKNVVSELSDKLSKLQTLKQAEKLADFLIITEDDVSAIVDYLFDYFVKEFNYHVTGVKFLDDTVGGMESGMIHIIGGPTNHGKSLFMLNLFRQMFLHNSYKENDIVIWITLEDRIPRLLRRMLSIFSNVRSDIAKHVYKNLALKIKSISDKSFGKKILESFIVKTIFHSLKEDLKKVRGSDDIRVPAIVLKHSDEYSLTTADIEKFIDIVSMKGYNPVLIYLDYLDLTLSANPKNNTLKDYDIQGYVVQELKSIATNTGVPIITCTQNQRIAEDPTVQLRNAVIGDSYKKVRFADYIYMIRQMPHLSLSDTKVIEAVAPDGLDKINIPDEVWSKINEKSTIIPVELTITKAKDSAKDMTTFLLFNTLNLRYYSTLEELVNDMSGINGYDLVAEIDSMFLDTMVQMESDVNYVI